MLMKIIVINFYLLSKLIHAIVIVEQQQTTNDDDDQHQRFTLLPKMIDDHRYMDLENVTNNNNNLSLSNRSKQQVNINDEQNNIVSNETGTQLDDYFLNYNQYMGWISIIYMTIISIELMSSRRYVAEISIKFDPEI
ncbi:hypothetical protein BLA29_001570 [Euroglyphus maynei]|uniref:Uncharacterized protein n=1 Tax=Euroglyphus maynei TaxID=6958 RepID=A0A1Y3B4P0_EURMA|nr:hypothetical protein BLA29_001570 [Euroglyphus maynei]